MNTRIIFRLAALLSLLVLVSPAVAQTSTPLSINCPPNRTNWLCGVASTAIVTYPAPTTTSACPTNAIVTCAPPSGAVFILGTTTVTCRATNSCRQSAVCSFTVTVARDTIPPVIQCPTNRIVWLCGTATTTAVVSWPLPTATDNADTRVAVACSPPSGSTFPLGTTAVSCTATDNCTNRTTCTFTVTVARDTQPPTITCPPNTNVTACASTGAVVNYPTPTATDNADFNVAVTCSPPSGSLFPLGSTTVTCTATDDCTNRTTCTFLVRVTRDTTPPSITCPSNQVVLLCGTAATIPVDFPPPTVSDNLDPNVTFTCVPASGSSFPVGTNTVVCTATDDCGNTRSCSFTVTVIRDATPPVMVCPTNRTILLCGSAATVPVNFPTPTATDNLDPNVTVACTPASGSSFPVGTTTVTCTATDDCTNRSTCAFTITVVRDTTPPVITCPSNMVFNCLCPGTVFNIDFFQATAVDDHDPNPTIVCNPPSIVSSPGVHVITCTATDNCGNSNRCSFTVTFNYDTIPPVITCPTNMNIWTCSNFARVNYSASATDTCTAGVNLVCTPPTGSLFPLGTTAVVCIATDNCTNRSTCTFTVTVRPPLFYNGLCHSTLGRAALNVNGDNELEVIGLGSSGEDGVRIELGESRGLHWQMKLPPRGEVDGRDFLVWQRGFGQTTAGTEIQVSEVLFAFSGGRFSLTPSAASYGLTLLRNGAVVYRDSGRSGAFALPVCTPIWNPHCFGEGPAEFPDHPFLPHCMWLLGQVCDVETPNGPVQADALVVTPEDPLPPFTALTALEFVGRDVPVLTLRQERLLMFGGPQQPPQPHRALGEARLEAQDGRLTLANLGSSGQDGVRIEMEESAGLQWRMRNPTGSPEGVVEFDVFGRTSAGAEIPLRRISHEYRGGQRSVTPGTGPYGVKLLRQGQVVFQQGGQTGAFVIPPCQPVEVEHCVGEPFAGWNPHLPYCITFLTIECDWETPNGPVRADTLVLTPEDTVPPIASVSAVRILGRNIRGLDSLTLLSERVLKFGGTGAFRLTCPPDMTVQTCSTNSVPVRFPSPVVNGGTCSTAPFVTCVPPSGSLFPPGVTTVQCTATNACGERAVCSFTVTVLADTTPPVITCPTNRTVTTSNPLGAPLSLNVETDDDWDAVPTVACVPPLTSVFPIGVTMVTCTATDDCGNRSQCNFKVTVVAGPGLPGTDTNGDGLSDIWQAHFNAHGLAPGEDTDGDVMNNRDEEQAGTDPRNRNSYLGVSASTSQSAGDVWVDGKIITAENFSSFAYKRFQYQFTSALGEPWRNVGDPFVETRELPAIRLSLLDTNIPPALLPQGFLRVSVRDIDDDGDGITAWEESIIGTSDLTPNTHGNPGGDYLAAQDWIVACGQVMFSPSVWNIDVPSARIQGRFLLNSRPFPSSFLQGANFFLRRISTGDEVYLGLSNNDTFDRRVVPGIYDVIYEHKIGDEVPLNSVAVVIAGLEISGDQVFDIDVPMVGVSGAYLLNGVPFSVSSIEFGIIQVRDAQTRALTMVGNTRDQTYSARLIPGAYDLMFSHRSGSTVPANELTAFRRDVPIVVSGSLNMDVSTISVTGNFTVNGAPPSGSVNDSGWMYLVDPDTGAKLLLGSTTYGNYQRVLIPGAYDVVYEQVSSIDMPANLSARFLTGVQFVADGTNDINIPVVEISGAFLVNGVPAPDNSLDFANIQLRQGEDIVYLGQTRYGHFSVRVIPGTYNVNFESLSSGSIMPANTNAVIASVVIAGPTVFDINIPAVDFAADVRFNGGNFPGPIAGESARLFLEDPLTGDLIPLSFDYPTSDYVARRMVRGTYRVRYEYESGTTLPRNTFATLGSSLVLTQNVQTVIDVRAVSLSGDFLLNGGAFPGGQFAGVTARSLLPGDSLYLGGTQSGAYSTVIVPGHYNAFYNWTVGDLIPRNQNARLICPRR